MICWKWLKHDLGWGVPKLGVFRMTRRSGVWICLDLGERIVLCSLTPQGIQGIHLRFQAVNEHQWMRVQSFALHLKSDMSETRSRYTFLGFALSGEDNQIRSYKSSSYRSPLPRKLPQNMGVSIDEATPIAGWFSMENSNLKWTTWGYPDYAVYNP